MVRHVRAVGPAVPYWDLVPVTTPTPTPASGFIIDDSRHGTTVYKYILWTKIAMTEHEVDGRRYMGRNVRELCQDTTQLFRDLSAYLGLTPKSILSRRGQKDRMNKNTVADNTDKSSTTCIATPSPARTSVPYLVIKSPFHFCHLDTIPSIYVDNLNNFLAKKGLYSRGPLSSVGTYRQDPSQPKSANSKNKEKTYKEGQ
ncbi:uncharacterized protein EV420DRAFT_1742594 [Desarmillaria tabescens]|uniref:Uncharacterized protein n=1 Tax=Armillaria tabescens TaxID=1929756 RepID=A0AA39NRG8_ARMTA|nr:uncharacterized protein EV420DRAFT_1742594 [Desarmillaria tabescens]KAK0470168.1 hypothetical protein EV420DRAFT_1742594 [Desarmillaria tabescens]